MVLPDSGHEDIPIEINTRPSLPLPVYFKQLAAIATVLILTVGLGLAVKLSQNYQGPSKAGSALVDRVDLSVNKIDSIKYGLSAQAVGSNTDAVNYQWRVSSTNSIGTLNIHSSNKYGEFTLNGNEGRADIWVAVDGGITNSYAITIGPHPVSWKSRTAWFKADYFYFKLGGRMFYGQSDAGTTVKIDDVSTDKLAVSWTEFGTPLTLSIFYNSVPEFDSEKINYVVSRLTVTDGVVTDTYKPAWTTRSGYPFESNKEDILGGLWFKNIYWFPGLYHLYDLDHSQWSWKHVQKMLPTRIMTPVFDGLFAPTEEINRSDMALFLARAYEYITQKKAVATDTPFTDIISLSPEVQDAIKKIYGLKITAGTSNTTYSPDTKVNRAQMATFLSNLYKAVTGDFAPEVTVPFKDIYGEDITWAQKHIARIYGLKVTAGVSPTEFGPYLVTTREQMATFIMNFIEAVNRVSIPPFPLPTPTPIPCVNSVPTVSLQPGEQSGSAGKSLNYMFSFTNNDSGPCPSSTVNLTASVPNGWTYSFLQTTIVVNPQQTKTATVSFTSLPTAVPSYDYVYVRTIAAIPQHSGQSSYAKYTVAPSLSPSPPDVTQTTQTFSQLANQLISPPPSTPPSSPNPLPPITIPPEASPAQVNIFIQIINLIQDFFKQILGLPQ